MPDYPYIFLLLFLLFFAFAELVNPKQSNLYFALACVIVFVFVAFRAPVVGADTWEYYKYAMGQQSSDYAEDNMIEPLFVLYSSFFANFCRAGLIYMVINTVLIFWPICYLLKKYTKYKVVAVLSFFILFNYIIYFVALRQLLSVSVLLLGVIYLLNEKKRKWLVFVCLAVVAFFVHKSAILIAIIFIACNMIRMEKRIMAIGLIVISAVAGVVLQSFDPMSIFNLILNNIYSDNLSKYRGFMMDELTESSLSIGTFINGAIGIICFLFLDKSKLNHWFTKIFLVGIILYNLFKSVQMVDRMLFPCLLFVIFVFPWILENKEYARAPFFRIMVAILLLAFSGRFVMKNTSYDIHGKDKMHPYYFFFEDYHNHPSILE